MKFSKEFTDWWEKYLKDNKVPVDKLVGYKTTYHDYFTEQWFINAEAVYDAFKAHDKELKQLREFKKKFQKLQNKLQQLDKKSYKDVQVEFKFNDVVMGCYSGCLYNCSCSGHTVWYLCVL